MKDIIKMSFIALTLSVSQSSYAAGEAELTGDPRIACEVLLCLSSPKDAAKTPECHPPLRHFYSIRARKWKNTINKRKKFLELCPEADEKTISHTLNQPQIFDDCNNKNNNGNLTGQKTRDCKKTEKEITPNKSDELENPADSDVEDTNGGYWQKKRSGIIIGTFGRSIMWGGHQNLEPGKVYTVVFYVDAGNGQSIRNTVKLTATKFGGMDLFLGDAKFKRGAPILTYDGNKLIDSYHKNGDTGEVIYDIAPKVREVNGLMMVY